MDALKFLRERKRMCRSHTNCIGCLLKEAECTLSSSTSDEDYEKIIAAVERWSKEHPRKTRQSEFLKQYPEARIIEDGVLGICPANVSAEYRDQSRCLARLCSSCRRKFWGQLLDQVQQVSYL